MPDNGAQTGLEVMRANHGLDLRASAAPRMSPSSFPAHGDHADSPSYPNKPSLGLLLHLSALNAQKSEKS